MDRQEPVPAEMREDAERRACRPVPDSVFHRTARSGVSDSALPLPSDERWATIWPQVAVSLASLHRWLGDLLEPGLAAEAPSPAELLRCLHSTASVLGSALAPEEQDLQQLIGVLNTGLALCWDMYSAGEAQRTSVSGHMERLEQEIAGYEADLERVTVESASAE